MIRSQALKLPVGDVPDWEVDHGSDSEPADLKSPAERRAVISFGLRFRLTFPSFVILQSLKQCILNCRWSMTDAYHHRSEGQMAP